LIDKETQVKGVVTGTRTVYSII